MYHQSVARHRSRRLVAGLLSCHGSFPMTLMLRLAVCIRGNLQGDGITALQVDHAVDDDRHLAGRSALLGFALSSWVNGFRHVRNKRQNNSLVLSMRYRRFYRS